MSEVLVSVIVPVYNVEKYINECVESLFYQTYKNIEILLIDDGSTDSSGEICDSLEKKYSCVCTYHKKNEGLGLTRNYGIQYANGKYVMFVDSDDYIDRDMINRMVNNAENSDADLVVEGYKKVTDNGEIIFVEQYSDSLFEGIEVVKKFNPRMVGSLPEKKDSIFTTVCAKLYRLDKIIDNDVKFISERVFQSEDLAFQFSICKYLRKVVVTEQAGYFYRTNPNSLTTSYKESRFDEIKKVYLYTKKQFDSMGLDEYEKLRADKMLYVQLKAAIAQERNKLNHKGFIGSVKNIKKMMNDIIVINSISKYPVKKLNIKQKFFLWLIKCKLAFITECVVLLGIL